MFLITHLFLIIHFYFIIIAQLVASSGKGLNPQTLRANQLTNTTTGNIQLVGTIQRPRTVPIAASPINAKQINNRGIITPQRNIAGATMKLGTPITGE